MYFVSDIDSLEPLLIGKRVKYFARKGTEIRLVELDNRSPSLQIVFHHGAKTIVNKLALTPLQLMNLKHFRSSGEAVVNNKATHLTLEVNAESHGEAITTMTITQKGRNCIVLPIDQTTHAEFCVLFTQQDHTPLIYRLYKVERARQSWLLKCFDKENAPLKLLSPVAHKGKPHGRWGVKPIPFPEYFTDENLHETPYRDWGVRCDMSDIPEVMAAR